jgi:hypothetical protein
MTEPTSPRATRTGKNLFIACGVWMVGLGLYFIFVRPPLLPEDPRFMGATLQQIQQSLPGLAGWLGMVFTVMGGFMISAGLLTLHAAWHLVGLVSRGTLASLALAGIAGVGFMSAVNFALHSDFRWLLLVPPLLWLAGLVALATGGLARSA